MALISADILDVFGPDIHDEYTALLSQSGAPKALYRLAARYRGFPGTYVYLNTIAYNLGYTRAGLCLALFFKKDNPVKAMAYIKELYTKHRSEGFRILLAELYADIQDYYESIYLFGSTFVFFPPRVCNRMLITSKPPPSRKYKQKGCYLYLVLSGETKYISDLILDLMHKDLKINSGLQILIDIKGSLRDNFMLNLYCCNKEINNHDNRIAINHLNRAIEIFKGLPSKISYIIPLFENHIPTNADFSLVSSLFNTILKLKDFLDEEKELYPACLLYPQIHFYFHDDFELPHSVATEIINVVKKYTSPEKFSELMLNANPRVFGSFMPKQKKKVRFTASWAASLHKS